MKIFTNSYVARVGAFCLVAVGTLLIGAYTAIAQTPSDPLIISNTEDVNSLTIEQSGDVGPGRSRSGALTINNNGNPNSALTLYSNTGSVLDPLMRLEIDSVEYDQPILHIRSDAETSHGLIRLDSSTPEIEFVETDQDNDRGEGKFEVRVQHDQFQINSRRGDNTTFEYAYTFTPYREGAKFGVGDIAPDAGVEIVQTGDFSPFMISSTQHADGDVLEIDRAGNLIMKTGNIILKDGCVVMDGACIDGSTLDTSTKTPASHTAATAETTSSVDTYNGSHEYLVMDVEAGEPSYIDCNSHTERGRFVLDHEASKVWVCNGPERGWDSLDLKD